MNSLVVQHHHQNFQIRSQNLMLKQLLASTLDSDYEFEHFDDAAVQPENS